MTDFLLHTSNLYPQSTQSNTSHQFSSSFMFETPTKVQPDQEGFLAKSSVSKNLQIETGFQPIEITYNTYDTYKVEAEPINNLSSIATTQDELLSLHNQVDKLLGKSYVNTTPEPAQYSSHNVESSYKIFDYISKPTEDAREVKSSYAVNWDERPMSFGVPQTLHTETYTEAYKSAELPRSYLEQERKSSIGTPYSSRSYDNHKIYDYLSKPVEKELVKSSYASHWEEKPLKTENNDYLSMKSYSSHPIFHTPASKYQPGYDEERLNKIVNRILKKPVELYGNRGFSLSQSVLDREVQNEKPVQSKPQASQPRTPAEPVVRNEKAYYCGDMENDKDSVVGGHIQQAASHYEANKQLYTNYYAGNLMDDVNEVPRVRRVGPGRRQEMKSIKKLRAEEAKKYFLEDESKLEDFDFTRHHTE